MLDPKYFPDLTEASAVTLWLMFDRIASEVMRRNPECAKHVLEDWLNEAIKDYEDEN